jgi:hypothetical protein
MLISGREARAILEGAGVSPRGARRVLASGLAGVPVVTRAAHLYDDERVREVAGRLKLTWHDLEDICPAGILIARRDLDVTATRAEQLAAVRDGWEVISMWRRWQLCDAVRRHGRLPFVASVSGFVALGADIVGFGDGSDLLLDPPGAWFSSLEERRLPTGQGRPWRLEIGPWWCGHEHVRRGLVTDITRR